jgi:hypothetical protein
VAGRDLQGYGDSPLFDCPAGLLDIVHAFADMTRILAGRECGVLVCLESAGTLYMAAAFVYYTPACILTCTTFCMQAVAVKSAVA